MMTKQETETWERQVSHILERDKKIRNMSKKELKKVS
jgi:hypothetical protein